MIRLAHLSDTHLGFAQYPEFKDDGDRNVRAQDFYRAFDQAITAILDADAIEQIDLVVHSGDIFNAVTPKGEPQIHLIRQLRRLVRSGIPTVLIAGNHETSKMRQQASALRVFTEFFGPDEAVYWAINERRELFEVETPNGQILVDCFPHGCVRPDMNDIGDERTNFEYAARIAVAHGIWTDNVLNQGDVSEGEMNAWTGDEAVGVVRPIDGFDWDYIAMGHLHNFDGDRDTRVYQVGSTERSGWRDESVSPGWNLVTIDAGEIQVERFLITTRPFLDLDNVAFDELDSLATVGLYAEGFRSERAVARILVTNVPPSSIRTVRDKVKAAIGDRFAYLQVDTMAPDQVYRSGETGWFDQVVGPNGDHPKRALPSLSDLFVEFLDSREDMTDDFKSRFKQKGIDAIDQAVEAERAAVGADA